MLKKTEVKKAGYEPREPESPTIGFFSKALASRRMARDSSSDDSSEG